MDSQQKRNRIWLRTLLTVVLTAAVAGPAGALFSSATKSSRASQQPAEQYHCPMHPSIVSDHPGECPICGMKLVKIEQGGTRTASPERKILLYRSPMDPRQTSPAPAKDSMGMDYVPVYEDDAPARSELERRSGSRPKKVDYLQDRSTLMRDA